MKVKGQDRQDRRDHPIKDAFMGTPMRDGRMCRIKKDGNSILSKRIGCRIFFLFFLILHILPLRFAAHPAYPVLLLLFNECEDNAIQH